MIEIFWYKIRRWWFRPILFASLLATFFLLSLPPTLAQEISQTKNSMAVQIEKGNSTQNLEVIERIGKTLRPSSGWLNTAGQSIDLEEIIRNNEKKETPTILVPSYFTCDRICPFIMKDLAKALDSIEDLQPGKDYNLISISINPEESLESARIMKEQMLKHFKKKKETNIEWLFLRAPENISLEKRKQKIDQFMSDLGYPFQKDGKDFFHSAVIIFINHNYQINRYIYGIEYRPLDIRLSLIEASEMQLGKSIDQIRLYCFRYDPTTGRYTTLMRNVLRLGGAITFFFLLAIIGGAIFFTKKRKHKIS